MQNARSVRMDPIENYRRAPDPSCILSVDPKAIHFDRLFVDPDMFKSRKAWRRSGFDVLDPAKDTECMVASHPTVPSYLFKKYANEVSQKEQMDNYAARVEGARRLAKFIHDQRLAHIVVPGKY